MAVKKVIKKVAAKKTVETTARKATKKTAKKSMTSKKTPNSDKTMSFDSFKMRRDAIVMDLALVLSFLDKDDLNTLERIGKEAEDLSFEILKNQDHTEEDIYLKFQLDEIQKNVDSIIDYATSLN